MLSSSNLKSHQAATYFEQDDYYSKEQGPGGSRWLGKGAEKLGLAGGVTQDDFAQVLKGRSPDGNFLFSREVNSKKRRAATDFTFSAPKSVSVAGLVQGDQRVIEAHHLAVERTLAVLEDRYSETRVMTHTGRKKIHTGNLIAAVFAHGTSREAEPQLHSHCVVMNATQIENGKWYSFLNDRAIAHKKLLGQIYQNELAVELQKLGYEIEPREHGQFDIKGYSKAVLDTFSTRRGQIEALVAEWQASGQVVRDAAGRPIESDLLLREAANLKTRKAKPQIVEAGKLLQSWQAVLAMKGLELPALPRLERAANHRAASILDDAIAHCSERDALFTTHQIEKFVFEQHLGAQSVVTLQQEIAEHPQLIHVGEDSKGGSKVTTRAALQLELQTIRLMQESQHSVQAIAPIEVVEASFEGSTLSEEQRHAIAQSCISTHQIIGWQGSAGAGKTYGLNAFRALAEAHSYVVSGYAPSSAAAHALGESLSIQTETVARLLISEPIEAEKSQRHLWLIDEAGLLSMRDAHELLLRARAQNARVVLVGDTKQLSAVEAGNPFKSLQAGGMSTFHLDETRRQQRAELRQAVQLMAKGQVGESIDLLEASGHISEISEESQITQMVSDFLRLPVAERAETLLLSGTNQNRLKLTQQIRAGLQREGSLGQDTFTMKSLQRKDLTVVQGRYASSYQVDDVIIPIRDYKQQQLARNQCYAVRAVDGATNRLTLETPAGTLIQIDPKDCDRKACYRLLAEEIAPGDHLKWTKNNRIEQTRNGQLFTVLSLSDEGMAQTIDSAGQRRELDLSGYQHVDYSWISTTYSSQGKTADRVMALLDQATTNKEAFYVAASRAKKHLQLYTADIGRLRELAQKSRSNENVSDYIPLFELTEYEPYEQSESSPSANHRRSLAGDAGRSVDHWQQSIVRSRQSEQSAASDFRGGTSRYGEQFECVLDEVAEHLKQAEFRQQAERVGEAAPAINRSAQYLEQGTSSVARLHRQVERTARSRQLTGAQWPKLAAARSAPKPILRPKTAEPTGSAPVVPAPILKATAILLQPPAPDASLRQNLDAFASVLGYRAGDRLYVRSLLPKHLSNELALKRNLKFEVDDNGTKRLVPNTWRGYLTVGTWAFTHIRRHKEPMVYADGLAKLSELNQEGRGIYFVVNPGGEADANISEARSLFWESDEKSKPEQTEQARTSGLQLGAIVETHKSIHCYSPLTEPLSDLENWKQLQERLIQRMDSDPAIRNSSRLMRLPGFDHVRVESTGHSERLVFTPVILKHLDQTAQQTVEELQAKLPPWSAARWQRERTTRAEREPAQAMTLAADNPWDIRNFAQHLNGDQVSQNGWLQVQCPEHGGEGHSGNSLHINEATGQFKCHGGCDSQAVYAAAWKLAESRGWQPPERAQSAAETALESRQAEPTQATRPIPRWERYSAGIDAPSGPQRDLVIAKRAIADGLTKKQVISLLAKNSPKAQKLYRDQGSTPAYNYIERVVKAAQQQGAQSQGHLKGKGVER
jgi:conjugative relaxase-like TrwC/TraI family protein